jgi:hypothetical protein
MRTKSAGWLSLAVLAAAHAWAAPAGAAPQQAVASAPASSLDQPWSTERANAWYARQPWLVGSNFLPADSINELEMWQAASFDPAEIDRELGWAQGVGMNTMRVFLHDLLWRQDPEGFKKRIDTFLTIAARHHIKPIFVLFDSCWDPDPKLGPQHPPIPGVHNSGWVQSPGTVGLEDPAQAPRLEAYVKGVVGAFAHDDRILAWDVWNEPDNQGGGNYDPKEPPHKAELVARLLPHVFEWARSQSPIQPLTSGVWHDGDWSRGQPLNPVETIQLAQSDVITFHNYEWPEHFAERIRQLQTYGRPIICTEYMARGAGSTFDGDLPIAKRMNVGVVNWGLVEGKSQTNLPWDSWRRPYVDLQPTVWFHDVFYPDGRPYREEEAKMLRAFTAAPKGVVPAQAQ